MAKQKSFFMKQAMMRKVLFATIPILIGATYFFGLRTLTLTAVVTLTAIITEYLFKRKDGKPVSEAVIVSAVLFTLALPVGTPYWVAMVGIIFGIVFAKEVFGGFGRNVFNPAIAGRTFIYVSFPEYLTATWNLPSQSFPGGFTKYITDSIETVSGATPLAAMGTADAPGLSELIIGNVSGSLGETSIILILVSAVYLLATKTADWKLMAAPLVGFVAFNSIFYMMGVEGVPDPVFGLTSGSMLFLSVFFVTEPISAPKTTEAKWIYGILIGFVAMIIRTYGIFIAGGMFALLIMNTFAPILDVAVKELKATKSEKGGNPA
ncbi:RnfABCDGE type electron transport complex subunit D [Isachenkonia alkalipeptolytica]|uniref:RnfABCDGE type electron transport complex subunit D n=1 Tax=Isachenkonia alkalipeptolytica TaxID=2565777 RepID=A0AA44BCL5_9CLOT|nr:RnfABCDGE type electron transport complex subunit D [Isachenkonia alkalipeptolytica]NBG87043.1 RnfABCDGE type electron transport complex subunit D [Isachenkonia alkalipeptolytica]